MARSLRDREIVVEGSGLDDHDGKLKRLQIAKAKDEYRIEFLLRALESRDAQLEQLTSGGVRTDTVIN